MCQTFLGEIALTVQMITDLNKWMSDFSGKLIKPPKVDLHTVSGLARVDLASFPGAHLFDVTD